MTFTLPINLKSANELLRTYWATRRKFRANYGWLLVERGLSQRFAPDSKQHVTITRVLGPRQRFFDPDNMAASCKSLIDAMRDVRLIRDDSPKWLTVDFKQDATRRADGPAVVVEIEEVSK